MPVARVRQPSSRMIELRDGRVLHARTWPGKGTPMVVLHGLLDSAEGWSELCRSLERPCIAFDLGGFGHSDLPTHPAFSAYADDVVAGIRALRLRRFVLVGHSFGGAVATAVAERIPAHVGSLVLLAPAGFGRIALAEAVSIPGIRNVADLLMPYALGNRAALAVGYRTMVANGTAPTEGILERVIDHRARLALAAREATKAVVRGGLSRSAFHRRRVSYDGPVVALWGDRDRLVPPAHGAGVAAAFPHAVVRVWQGVGHHHKGERLAELAAFTESICLPFDARPRVPAARAA